MPCVTEAQKRNENMWEKWWCSHKVHAEGWAGGPPGARAEIPWQLCVKTLVRQAVTPQPMEGCGGTDTQLQSTVLEQVDAKGGCGSVESWCWSRLLVEPLGPWRQEPMMEQVCWQDLRPCGGLRLRQSILKDHPMEGTHTGSVCEELQPLGRICIGEVCREQGQSFGWTKGLGFSLL